MKIYTINSFLFNKSIRFQELKDTKAAVAARRGKQKTPYSSFFLIVLNEYLLDLRELVSVLLYDVIQAPFTVNNQGVKYKPSLLLYLVPGEVLDPDPLSPQVLPSPLAIPS